MKRKKISKSKSKKLFRATAGSKRINIAPPRPMRGGFRL